MAKINDATHRPDNQQVRDMMFVVTREAGLAQLSAFVDKAGRAYHEGRNFDLSSTSKSTVSQLSPWLRHRLVSEHEVLSAVLDQHSSKDAMAFVQEVFWRGYFKGWLEQHPSVWQSYNSRFAKTSRDPSPDYYTAINGTTGIECFDFWCAELRETGYLHNHARMWFASIWIFTLRLPWEMGAAFFLDHLFDGDPASNTLSWRWVAGLHTKGKNYVATAENIARFTDQRFFPKGQLNEAALPLEEDRDHAMVSYDAPLTQMPSRALRLITEEDCHLPSAQSMDKAGVLGVVSPNSAPFAQAAVQNTVAAAGGSTYVGHNWSVAIKAAADEFDTRDVVTAYLPIGHAADGMQTARANLMRAGVTLHTVSRQYDTLIWPHATKGFFKLKKKIPQLLEALHL